MLSVTLRGLRPELVVFRPDGRLLAADRKQFAVFDPGGQLLRAVRWPPGRSPVMDPAFAPAGDQASVSTGPRPAVLDIDTGEPVAGAPLWRARLGEGGMDSPCGRWRAEPWMSGFTDLRRGKRGWLGEAISEWAGRRRDVFLTWPLRFSPDGELLAVSSRPTLFVLRTADLAAIPQPDGRRRKVAPPVVPFVAGFRCTGKHWRDAAFTPDGRTLLAVSSEGTVRSWETDQWTERPPLALAAGPLKRLAVSPDGLRAAAAGTKAVVVWDLD